MSIEIEFLLKTAVSIILGYGTYYIFEILTDLIISCSTFLFNANRYRQHLCKKLSGQLE